MLRKCLTTPNVIESSMSGAHNRTGRVTRWRSGETCLRWAAAAPLETERNLRKIIGHEDLGMLKAVLYEGRLLGARDAVRSRGIAACAALPRLAPRPS